MKANKMTIELLTKKEKEITLLQDKIKEYDTQIKATANTIKEKEESIKKEIQKVKEDNNSLMNELNQKSNIIEELDAHISSMPSSALQPISSNAF